MLVLMALCCLVRLCLSVEILWVFSVFDGLFGVCWGAGVL